MSEKETEFVELMRERFEKDEMGYNEETDFLFLINAPEQYKNEDKMMKFAKQNPDATMKELIDYFDEITPDGLPDCIDPDELAEED